jgi:hypothetical protein
MLLFRSGEDAHQWCQDRDRPGGTLLGLDQVWALSRAWYSNRLDLGYAGRSGPEIAELFRSVGLTGHFWELQ